MAQINKILTPGDLFYIIHNRPVMCINMSCIKIGGRLYSDITFLALVTGDIRSGAFTEANYTYPFYSCSKAQFNAILHVYGVDLC